jgi:RNA polymerase sigma factor (sigma-70 family)
MLLVEDRELLMRFRQGERRALEKVYLTFGPSVAQLLRSGFSFSSGGRQCRFKGARSEFDLEDRLHDVFTRAFSENARNGYDGLSPYRAYLLAIARNAVIDDFRRKETALVEYAIEEEVAAPIGGTASEPISGQVEPSGDPHVDAEAAELAKLVRDFKSGLDSRELDVFRLRFELEKEHKDIEQEIGLSPSKIKTSEQRIRARFFEFMKERGYFVGYRKERGGWLSALRSF